MSYKYRNGSTPDHQINIEDMDGVDNVRNVVDNTRNESMQSSQSNLQTPSQSNTSNDLSGLIKGVKSVGGVIKDFVESGGVKIGSALASAVPKYGPMGPGNGVIRPKNSGGGP